MRHPATITALAALVLAAGCGGDDETTTSAPTTTSSTTTTEAAGTTGPEDQGTTAADEPEGGGDDGGAGSGAGSAGSTPEDALEAFFVSGDPDVACGEVVTPEFVAEAYGDERGCRAAQVPDATPKSIEVKRLEQSGDTAEAVVVPEGGPNDGFDHEVTLVLEGDTWLIDSLEADIPAGP